MPNYNPCSKYDYAYKVLLHKINYVTGRADMDGTIDESTWGFGGYMGECGGRSMGKKVPKGGQTTFLMDIHRRYPRAYIHRHKLQNPKTHLDGFSYQEPAKVVDIVKQVDGLIDGADPAYTEMAIPNTSDVWKYPRKKIYQSPPHITADNHFSGDNIMKFMGGKGYGCTITYHRDCFPVGIKQCLHQEKIKGGIRWQRQ